ncbi:carbohydrate-binding protein, partial [Verrucomicrobiales bacterium]|nr:carbohydrate-binding protein [Verrucomicrobiales bacterium]
TTGDSGGGLNIGYIENGDWSQYSVTIPAAGDYLIEFRTASNNDNGGEIDIVSNGVPVGNLTVPDTNGWQNWSTITANVTFSTAGTKTLRLNYTGGSGSLFNINWFSISPFTPEAPLTITVGNTRKQQMRYGIDYERLWFWSGSNSEKRRWAEWSVADCDVDYVRVAVNSAYELTEGTYDLNAYTNKIIPMMNAMKDANPDVKFFGSPRPLNEAISGVAWQPYPQWVTGSTGNRSNFDFDEVKCSEYLLRYLILMKQYGFKISYLDLTNEWNNINGTDFRDISALFDAYVAAPANAKPVVHPTYPRVTLTADDIPELVGASAWSYTQGRSWLNGLTTGLRRDAVDIVSSHNTDKGGTAQAVVDRVESVYANDDRVPEVWNTELHGWKSTSNADEVLTYAYMMECINAGFSGISGWLAIGFSNQGHCYIVNKQRSVKYYMFEKLTNTSNRGYALDVNEPDEFKVYWDSDPDQADADSAVSALIRGNLMTVWLLNHSDKDYPITINPTGRTISDHPIKVTRWSQIDGIKGEGEIQTIEAETDTSVVALAQDNSAYCFEILLEPEVGSYVRIEAEGYDRSSSVSPRTQATTDLGAGLNLNNISDGNWTSYDDIDLSMATDIRFRIAAPSGRPDGEIEIRTGSQAGPVIGRTAIPATGNWQEWLTIETPLEATTGTHDLYLVYTEAGSNQTGSGVMFNLNWFELITTAPPSAEAPINLTEAPVSGTSVTLNWDAVPGATGYTVKGSLTQGGPYSIIDDTVTGATYTSTGLTAGTPYYFVIVTRSGGIESDESAEIVAVPSNPISVESIDFRQMGIGSDGAGGEAFLFSLMNSEPGHMYQAQGSSSLDQADWTEVGAENPGNGGVLDFVMPIS